MSSYVRKAMTPRAYFQGEEPSVVLSRLGYQIVEDEFARRFRVVLSTNSRRVILRPELGAAERAADLAWAARRAIETRSELAAGVA